MATQKWHLLYHLVDAISDTERREYLYRGFYEGAHTIFKALYRKSSERQGLAMDGTVKRYNPNVLRPQFPEKWCRRFT